MDVGVFLNGDDVVVKERSREAVVISDEAGCNQKKRNPLFPGEGAAHGVLRGLFLLESGLDDFKIPLGGLVVRFELKRLGKV